GSAQPQRVFETSIAIDGRRFICCNVELRSSDLFQTVEAERKAYGRQILTECRRQTVITAASADFETEVRNVGPKQNSRVVIESAHFAQIDGEMPREIEFFENRVDLFEMIERLHRAWVSNHPARFLKYGPPAG